MSYVQRGYIIKPVEAVRCCFVNKIKAKANLLTNCHVRHHLCLGFDADSPTAWEKKKKNRACYQECQAVYRILESNFENKYARHFVVRPFGENAYERD